MLLLTIIQGPDKGQKFELPDHEPQLIGRSSEALATTDNAISRRHAELTPDDGVWYVRDLDSQNGTHVNGVRISGRVRLKPGDQVRTGRTLWLFGVSESRERGLVKIVGSGNIQTKIERRIPSVGLSEAGELVPRADPNDDSVILAEPEPRAAALDHLRIIYRLSSMLSSRVMSREQLLEGVMDLVFSEFSPQRGCIMVSHDARGAVPDSPETMRFEPLVVRYKEAPLDPEDAKIHVSKTILYHAVTKAEGVLSSNAMTDPRFAKGDSVQRLHIRSAVCSPIRFRERIYGAIYIDSSMANYTFTPEQLALMNAVGQHAGLALANAELYRQKLQSERLAVIGETVASLSHSIKNILQGLRGGADVVEMGLKKGDLRVAQNGWPIVRRNLDRIVSLTVNMLAFSRQRQISPDLHRVGGIVEDCAQLLESTARGKGVALIADVDPEMPPLHVDAPVLHQAVLNLLTNAVEAAPEKTGAVTVRAAYHPFGGSPHAPQHLQGRPLVEIVVIDNGPGIPLSKQAWVFEPFNTTKGMKGTGLGLAVAKRVAEQHGGVLVLESAEGKGAAFRMLLPVDWTSAGDPSATHGEE